MEAWKRIIGKEMLGPWMVALTSLVLHLGFSGSLGFHRDELLYFTLGLHPDAGYFSVPPVIGLLAFLQIHLFGPTLLAAKLWPALVGGGLILLVSEMAAMMGGGRYARFLSALAVFSSVLFLRAFGLFQPVFLDIFCWTLSFFWLLKYIRKEEISTLYWLGITFGLGLLCKYNLLFLIFSIVMVLPFTRYRKLFGNIHFYGAILLALVLVMPNILWQFTHDLPIFAHFAELERTQLHQMTTANFISEQLLMIFPATVVALPGLYLLCFHPAGKRFRMIGWITVVVLVIYLLMRGKSYYTAGIYPFLLGAGAVWYEQSLRWKAVRILIPAFLLFFTWLMLPMGIPTKSPQKLVDYFDRVAKVTKNDAVRRYEDNRYEALPQDYADMLGWDELAGITGEAWSQVREKEHAIVFADNYGEAGAVAILGKPYHLPEALSFNDQFRFWTPASFATEIKEMVYINEEPGEDVRELFAEIRLIGAVSNPLARERGTKVFLCREPRESFNKLWVTARKKFVKP
ncbi:MAG: glycosyltransferase family 39 protein [Marinilabiliales bacterium]|nr:glycosyltransferase family 39 protein [Marinilabiliales bacterium]